MTLGRAALEHCLEAFFVLVTRHESRGHLVHESLRELAVSRFHDVLEDRIVFFEVGGDQIWLLLSLPETLHLQSQLFKAFLRAWIGDIVPKALLEFSVRNRVITQLADD